MLHIHRHRTLGRGVMPDTRNETYPVLLLPHFQLLNTDIQV
ncbi:hypothetical protein DAD186_14140 [Dermabacter vaginalis]|uniref:Uncharacterized protein n=1 Tax=Dermabacter vaginalis TaxID=1630135 RepID=A0A1B0ZJ01_9MICO|nr:hypothetical protein DAD186_14140 [Dermabacter vaginalis]